MNRIGWIFACLLLLTPTISFAEEVRGKLNDVSFSEGIIEVNGIVYNVITEETRVSFHGERMGEEDLRPGDDVVLVLGKQRNRGEKRDLRAVILVRGSKGGLDS